jgi:hypothetical protein
MGLGDAMRQGYYFQFYFLHKYPTKLRNFAKKRMHQQGFSLMGIKAQNRHQWLIGL